MEEYRKIWATKFRYPQTLDQILEQLDNEGYIPLKEYPNVFLNYAWDSPNLLLKENDIVIFLGSHDLKKHIEILINELSAYSNEFSADDFDILKDVLEDDLSVAERYNGKIVGYTFVEKQFYAENRKWIKYHAVKDNKQARMYEKDYIHVDDQSFIELKPEESYYLLSTFQNAEYPVDLGSPTMKDGTIAKYHIKNGSNTVHKRKTYSNNVQSFVMNNSFATTPDELLYDMQERGKVLLDDLLDSEFNEWSAPRWCKIGDIVFFMFKKTANATISATRTQYRKTINKYSQREQRLIEIGLKRGTELFKKYGGCIFGFGRISADNYYQKVSTDDNFHWNSPIYAAIEDLYFLDVPIHIDDFREFLTISRANSFTPVLGEAFDKLRNLIVERNDVPDYFREVSTTPIPLRSINDKNWIEYGMEYRRNFFLEDAFRRYYVDYLLSELGDKKAFFRECCCYKGAGNPPRVDNVIFFAGKLLPVEVKLSIGNERDLPGQVKQYCHVDRIVLDVEIKNNGNILYDENVLIIDREYIYVYDDVSNQIQTIYNLDELTDASKITELKEIILLKLSIPLL